jgi:hypothetical protein
VERIIEAASNHNSESKYLYHRFGRYARDEDLDLILNRVIVETNAETCLRLLWVFRRKARLPRLDARVLALASDRDPRMREAATMALSSLSSPIVGELGRQLLRDGSFNAERSYEIELFANNYQEGDEILILTSLENLVLTDDEAHYLGMSVLRICENNDSKALVCLAKWIYQTNPCTICRNSAITLIRKWSGLPSIISNECRYDASREIREQVSAL